MPTGTVKWFNSEKGYGFITPSKGGADAFVHVSQLEQAGIPDLKEGDLLSYELKPGRDSRQSAHNLKRVDRL